MPAVPPYLLFNEDCFKTFSRLRDASVDLVLCDPPYGTTRCKWDSVIPLEPMWEQIWRVCTPTAAVVLTAAQPFTSFLISGSMSYYRYSWVWNKVNSITGFLNARKQPLRVVEDVLVFCQKSPRYFPQGLQPTLRKLGKNNNSKTQVYGNQKRESYQQTVTNYPKSILPFATERNRFHPTQKPVALMEYLIKTYTLEGETVLDFAMGSGTTGVACGNLGRKFIGCDSDKDHGYFETAKRRIAEAYRRGAE